MLLGAVINMQIRTYISHIGSVYNIYIYIYMYIHMCTHTYLFLYMYIYIYIKYRYTHIHIYDPGSAGPPPPPPPPPASGYCFVSGLLGLSSLTERYLFQRSWVLNISMCPQDAGHFTDGCHSIARLHPCGVVSE